MDESSPSEIVATFDQYQRKHSVSRDIHSGVKDIFQIEMSGLSNVLSFLSFHTSLMTAPQIPRRDPQQVACYFVGGSSDIFSSGRLLKSETRHNKCSDWKAPPFSCNLEIFYF